MTNSSLIELLIVLLKLQWYDCYDFWTCHDSCAILASSNICSNQMIKLWNLNKSYHNHIWVIGGKLLMKWVTWSINLLVMSIKQMTIDKTGVMNVCPHIHYRYIVIYHDRYYTGNNTNVKHSNTPDSKWNTFLLQPCFKSKMLRVIFKKLYVNKCK